MYWTPPNSPGPVAAPKGAPTSKFATVGKTSAQVENASGAPSANTHDVPRKGSSGGMMDAVTANHRAGILERQGARWGIKETLYAPNAAEASATQRNVRTVPSAVGNRDFWASRREFGQG